MAAAVAHSNIVIVLLIVQSCVEGSCFVLFMQFSVLFLVLSMRELASTLKQLRLTQISMNFITIINVKMPTTVGILSFISMINATGLCI